MIIKDTTIENLLELDGVKFVIDEKLGLWVKFEVRKVQAHKHRPHGIKYSLTLHDSSNNRLLGFDNAHSIEYSGKNTAKLEQIYDHWHKDSADKGRPYQYVTAAKLLEDFWIEVDKVLKRIGGNKL